MRSTTTRQQPVGDPTGTDAGPAARPYGKGSPAPKGTTRRHRDDRRVAPLFIVPVLLGFAVFYLYPTIRGIWWSLTDYTLIGTPTFVGLDNYAKLVHDAEFWNSMLVTTYYVALNIVTQTVAALALAALLHRLTRSVMVRTVLLLPWLVPNVTVGLLWMWLLDTNLGFVNSLLGSLGLGPVGFLTSPDLVIPTISLINTWSFTGYTALLFYAGMLQIPKHLYEAAAIDGAGEWRVFSRITLPLLRPILALVLVVSLIGSFQIFDTVAVTTEGGPVNASRVIYYYIYQQAFEFFDMGYAAALAIVLVVILGLLTAVQMRLLRASRSELV